MPSRRAVLAAGGLALTGGLAGCNSTPPPPKSTFKRPTSAWPTAGYDPAGTGNPPEGPSDVAVAWRRSRASFDPRLYGVLSTPVVADGTVYVAALAYRRFDPDDMTSALVALDAATGEPAWHYTAPSGLTGGPALVDDPPSVVVGGRDGILHAVDTTGTERWHLELGGELGTPTVYGDRVYVASGTGRLHAVDAEGNEVWTADLPGVLETVFGSDEPVETALPVADDHGVYAAFTPFDRDRDATSLHAFGHDGRERWQTTLPGRYGHTPGGLAVTGDALYVTVGGTVYALNPTNGRQRWQFVTGTDRAGPPTTEGDTVYVAAKNLYALHGTEGTERWRVVNEAPVDERDPKRLPYLARPPVTSGQVYLRAGAFATADGRRRWGDDAEAWLQSGDYFTDPFFRRPMARPVVTADAVYLAHAHHGVVMLQ